MLQGKSEILVRGAFVFLGITLIFWTVFIIRSITKKERLCYFKCVKEEKGSLINMLDIEPNLKLKCLRLCYSYKGGDR
jgi:hypothetical protein